jgi:hypothetical protein
MRKDVARLRGDLSLRFAAAEKRATTGAGRVGGANRVLAKLDPEAEAWDEIAAIEGVSKRTLQHFWRQWLDGLEVPRR